MPLYPDTATKALLMCDQPDLHGPAAVLPPEMCHSTCKHYLTAEYPILLRNDDSASYPSISAYLRCIIRAQVYTGIPHHQPLLTAQPILLESFQILIFHFKVPNVK